MIDDLKRIRRVRSIGDLEEGIILENVDSLLKSSGNFSCSIHEYSDSVNMDSCIPFIGI